MRKLKRILLHPRIIVLIVALLIALLAINPAFNTSGVVVLSIDKDSAAARASPALPLPTSTEAPRSREVISHVNGQRVHNMEDFYSSLQDLPINTSVRLNTNKGQSYRFTVEPLLRNIPTNQTQFVNRTVEKFNNETNTTENVTQLVEEQVILQEVIGVAPIGINVLGAPQSNLRKGLDLAGGTRVILQPEREATPEEMAVILNNIKERLNVFGLSDIVVREAKDLDGVSFITVEITGANSEQVRELISKQGDFQAKVGNITVFRGGDDIRDVCLKPECSGLDFQRRGCGAVGDGTFACGFFFTITLSGNAAQIQADATRNLGVIVEGGQSYLTEDLELYLDGDLVDSLRIGADLRGSAVTDIQISGSGFGANQEAAQAEALVQMHKLQSILETGSLPVKLTIVKSDSISPVLGQEFLRNALLLGFVAAIAVMTILFIAYRKWYLAIPIGITMLSEVFLLLGVAALIRWDLDLAAIAGIIVAIGTGVDDQIVITDETLRGLAGNRMLAIKDRFKRAFFVIFTAYFATVVAMAPLLFAGAGLLKGFAFTTIIGVTIGVLITRPAFAAILEMFVKQES